MAGRRVSRGSLLLLADALHVPASWLIDGEGTFNPEWVNPRPLGPQPEGTTVAVGPFMPFPEPASRAAAQDQAHFIHTQIDAAILAQVLQLVDMIARDEPYEVRARRIARAYDEATLPADQLPPLPVHIPHEDPK